jgi:hypothetical protein
MEDTPMRPQSAADLADALAKVESLLGSVDAELATMPRFKRGTTFHLDRVSARQRLLSQRETLRDRQRQLIESN